jgi:hypothetical protein
VNILRGHALGKLGDFSYQFKSKVCQIYTTSLTIKKARITMLEKLEGGIKVCHQVTAGHSKPFGTEFPRINRRSKIIE